MVDKNGVGPSDPISKIFGLNLPLPELCVFLIGVAMYIFGAEGVPGVGRVAFFLAVGGMTGPIMGLPLLLVPIKVFWFDVAYIIVGFSVFFYTMSFMDGSYLLGLLIPICSTGVVIAGFSFILRRLIALSVVSG